MYTLSLLALATTWTHSDLSLYVDDGAIYTVSVTTSTAMTRTCTLYQDVLKWLHKNGLQADSAKTELMVFRPSRSNPNLSGGNIHGARYTDPSTGTNRITTVTSLQYLGVHIDHRLNWTKHVTIIATRARSTIHGVTLLGNSIHGLDLLNWRKVYNALIIPVLTYGTQVWYTGHRQKGLIAHLQTAQNEGLHKMTGVFKTTPIDPLHNLIGIPPISYLLPKLMNTYSLRLQGSAPNALIRTVLLNDQCCYWPESFLPPTTLRMHFKNPAESTYWLLGPTSARPWSKPRLTYIPKPTAAITARYKHSLATRETPFLHIIITPSSLHLHPAGVYQAIIGSCIISSGYSEGVDHTQALFRTVYNALTHSLPQYDGPVILWA